MFASSRRKRKQSGHRQDGPRVPGTPRRRSCRGLLRTTWLSLELLEDRWVPAGFTNVLVNDPTLDHTSSDTQSETSAVLGPGGNIIVGYNDSGSTVAGSHFTGFSTSADGGGSFTDKGVLPNSPDGDAGDPALARDATTGRVYFATLGFANNNLLQVFRSDDNGATFGAPVNGAPGFDGTHFLDKEWITVDNATASGPGRGNVYLTFTDFGGSGGVNLTRSSDGGNTWSPAIALGGLQGSYVTVGPDHAVYVFFWGGAGSEQVLMRKSTDLGVTFGPTQVVANLATTGVNGDLGLTVSNTDSRPVRSNAFPQAAVAVTSSGIYAVFNDTGTTAGDKADVFFTQSTDGGATWTPKLKINDDATTTDQWQPSLAVTPDGQRVGVFWYDRRNDPNNGLIDRYGRIGKVSGTTVTWSDPSFRITDVSFPAVVAQDPQINPTYMGDYDVALADNQNFYVVWADNRLSNSFHANQPDVRLAKIPAGASPALALDASNFSISESAGFATVQVDRFGDPSLATSVHYSTSDGSGTTPEDYLPTSGTLVWAPGDKDPKTFTVPIVDDGSVGEINEIFNVALDSPTNGIQLADPKTATVTILEDAHGALSFDPTSATVDEASGRADLTVRRTGGLDGTVTVTYLSNDGSAKARLDYTGVEGTLTFVPGQDSQTISVPLLDDGVGQDDSNFIVELVSPGGGAVLGGNLTAQVTIQEKQHGQLALDASSYVVIESPNSPVGTLRANVLRTGGSDGTVSVNLRTLDGTAKAGTDYVFTTGPIVFGPGVTSLPITVPLIEDGIPSADGMFTLALDTPTGGATLGTLVSAPVTITEPLYGQLALDATNHSVDESAGSVTIMVVRTGGADNAVTVHYSTANDSAQAGVDYTPSSGTLTFAAGEASKSLVIPLLDDGKGQNDVAFNLALDTPLGGATLGTIISTRVTIKETQFGQLQFPVGGFSVDEKSLPSLATITVTRTGGSDGTVTAHYNTADGTARAAVDYVPASGTVTFAPGQVVQTFTVALLDDIRGEADEMLQLSLSTPGGGATLASPVATQLTIRETAFGAIQFNAAAYPVPSSTAAATVRVLRVGGTDNTATVRYATADGTAKAGADYTAASGMLTFGPGVLSQTISVPVLGGNNGGTFSMSLDGPTGGAILGTVTTAQVTLRQGPPPPEEQVVDGVSGVGAANPSGLVAAGGLVFYSADDGVHGRELWATDGTTAGTFLVADINAGQAGSDPTDLINVNGTVFFTADDGIHGRELWKSDGTAAGTVMVADVVPGAAGSAPTNLTNASGTVFFAAGGGLWRSDGTTSGTVLLPGVSAPDHLTAVGRQVFFSASGPLGVELYKSDGTTGGTVLVKDINPAGDSLPTGLTIVNGTLYFTADNGHDGRELWKSDGTVPGTTMVADINQGFDNQGFPFSSAPHNLTNINGTLFFAATTNNSGDELWRSDGTAAGTAMVKDIQPNQGGSEPQWLTNVSGTLFFVANSGTSGAQLWRSDGSSAGTTLVKAVSGTNVSPPDDLTAVGSRLFFTADDGTHGRELWQSDGTAAGTFLVDDLWPGAGGSSPAELVNLNGGLLLRADDGTTGDELWRANGLALSIKAPGSQTVPAGGMLLFSAAGHNGLVVADPGPGPVQVNLTATGGTLTLPTTAGVTFTSGTGSQDKTATFFGTLAAVNAALDGLTFTPTGIAGSPASLLVSVTDLGGPAFGPAGIVSAPVAIIVGPAAPLPPTTGGPPVLLAAAGRGSSVLFAVHGHSVFRHDASGWVKLGDGVASIGAVTDSAGTAVLFALMQDHALFRYDTGWHPLGASGTVAQASPGTDLAGAPNVFVVTTVGDFYEFSQANGWQRLGDRGTVASFSAGDRDRVAVVTTDRSVFEHDGRLGWLRLTSAGFAGSVSAVGDVSGRLTVFALTVGNSLFRYDATAGWHQLGDNIKAASAGHDPAGHAAAFAQTLAGDFFQRTDAFGWKALAAPGSVAAFTAADVDRAFVTLVDGSVFGYDDAFGFFRLTGSGFVGP